ncbi:MAG: putative transposase [Phenylobacterium sp.]|jgi:putative transposase
MVPVGTFHCRDIGRRSIKIMLGCSIFGDETFKQWIFDELMPQLAAEGKSRVIQPNLSMPIVVEGVAAYYNTTLEVLLKSTRGPQHDNEPRKVAISPK